MAKDNILNPKDDAPGLDDEPIRLEDENEPISLVGADESSDFAASGGVRTFGVQEAQAAKTEFRRPLNADGSGATRIRLFHSKIAITSLEHMETQINDWLDGDRIEVKHVGHLIGTMEGKRPEPNLLVIVWY